MIFDRFCQKFVKGIDLPDFEYDRKFSTLNIFWNCSDRQSWGHILFCGYFQSRQFLIALSRSLINFHLDLARFLLTDLKMKKVEIDRDFKY